MLAHKESTWREVIRLHRRKMGVAYLIVDL